MNNIEIAARCQTATADEQRELLEALWEEIAPQRGLEWAKLNSRPFCLMLDAEAYVDAALVLMPDEHFWSVTMRGERRGGYHACCAAPDSGGLEWLEASTPALAILSAICEDRA